MTTPSWHLVDADPVARENQYTFYKPSPEAIAKVKPGENVKLIFRFQSEEQDAPEAERMWAIVDTVQYGGQFTGRLDNQPRWIKDLQAGDALTFSACHIINTEHPEPDNLVERFAKRSFVTQRVLKDGARVGYVYREEPDDEQDSGWRFMANDESQEYMDTKGNVEFVPLGRVLSCDDSFVNLLEAGVGSAFLLDEEANVYLPVSRDA